MSRLVHIAFLAMIVSCAAGVQASSPRLNLILPRGVQRGGEHVLTFSGANLGDAEQVLFYGEGFEVTKLEPNDKEVKVTVKVAPDCRLGEHVGQIRTRSGVSDFRTLFVGALPAIDEVEPNQLLIKTPWGELYDVDVDKKKVMNTINLDLPFDSMSAMTLDMHNDQKVLTLSGNEKNDYPLSITETKASSPKNHAQVTLKNQEVLLNYSKKYKINELTLESIEKRKE